MSIGSIIEYIQKTPELINYMVILIACLSVELYLGMNLIKIKSSYRAKHTDITDLQEAEEHALDYYHELQKYHTLRMVNFIGWGVLFIVARYNITGDSISVALTLTALLVLFREPVVSFASYFYVIARYRTGDNLGIETHIGEIVRMQILSTSIAGKDDKGEYNGKLYNIPNYLFLQKVQERRELRIKDYRKTDIRIFYNKGSENRESLEFDHWLDLVKNHLNELLPERTLAQVGNFKSYAGCKYRLDFEHMDKGVFVIVSFVSSFEPLHERKESIMRFVLGVQAQEVKPPTLAANNTKQ